MAKYFDVHPVDPQPRAIAQAVQILRDGGLIAYPTDSCFALGCSLDNPEGKDRILRIRGLDERHHFTLVCADFAQLGQFAQLDNSVFRAVKAHTPGPYTFILPATREVPRRLLHPKKRTVGVRIPDHPVVRGLLRALGEPILSSTLLLPGDEEPMTDGGRSRIVWTMSSTPSSTPGSAVSSRRRWWTSPTATRRSLASGQAIQPTSRSLS